MTPTVQPAAARPTGVSRAAAEAAQFQKDQAAAQQLRDVQTVHAREIKLKKLARANHDIAELLDEHTALKATVDELRQQTKR